MSFIASAISLCLAIASAATQDNRNCVTNIAEFSKLSQADHAEHRPFRVTGTVLAVMPWAIAICNDSWSVSVERPDGIPLPASSGDRVRVVGHLVIDEFKRHTQVLESVELLERGEPPQPIEARVEDLSGDRYFHQRVRLAGTMASVHRDEFDPLYNWMALRTPDGNFFAAVHERLYPIEDLRTMVDGEVSVEGIATPFANYRMPQGAFVTIFEKDALRVLRPSVGDHFDVPTLSNARNDVRQCVYGIVLASCENRFFIQTESHACIAVYLADASFMPKPGDEVNVAGYATKGMFDLQMSDAMVKMFSDATHELPPAVADLGDTPFETDVPDKTAHEYHGRIVRVSGVVLLPDYDTTGNGLVSIVSNRHRHLIDISGLPLSARDHLRPSATVEVTGLCIAEYEAHAFATGFCQFKGFTVIPRQIADIRTIKSPPWWTIGRLFIVIMVLVGVVIIVLVWNRMLRKLSERRGQQLYREQIEHERASMKIEERTRLAIELHDSISQTLTGVAMQVESASRANAGANAAVHSFLQTGIWMLSSCRRELKSCLWDLHRRTFGGKGHDGGDHPHHRAAQGERSGHRAVQRRAKPLYRTRHPCHSPHHPRARVQCGPPRPRYARAGRRGAARRSRAVFRARQRQRLRRLAHPRAVAGAFRPHRHPRAPSPLSRQHHGRERTGQGHQDDRHHESRGDWRRMKTQKTRILIADDHLVVRIGISSVISLESDMTVVGEASCGAETVAMAHELRPDVIIMDLMMPEMNGAEATERILGEDPGKKILILTSYTGAPELSRALKAGACGVLDKDSSQKEIIDSIRKLMAGENAIDPKIRQGLENSPTPLTPRQTEALKLAAKGFSNKEIAKLLGIGAESVKDRLAGAFLRLNASTRSEAVAIALDEHLI